MRSHGRHNMDSGRSLALHVRCASSGIRFAVSLIFISSMANLSFQRHAGTRL